MNDLIVPGLLCYLAVLVLANVGWRGHVFAGLFWFVLVSGTSVLHEKRQLGRILARAVDLTESYARERQALAKNVLLLSTQLVSMSKQDEQAILGIIEHQAPANIPEQVRAIARSAHQLNDEERLAAVTRAVAASKTKMAETRAQYEALQQSFEKNSIAHVYGYWAIEDALGITSTLPRTFPVWPEPPSTSVKISPSTGAAPPQSPVAPKL